VAPKLGVAGDGVVLPIVLPAPKVSENT